MGSSKKFSWSMITSLVVLFGFLMLGSTANSLASTIRVPQDEPTIAAAIGAANPNDTILVDHGNWCGAEIDKPLDMEGKPGATVIGCSSNPATHSLGYRIGFLVDAAASGTIIHNFTFDGRGWSDSNLNPVGLGVVGREGTNNVVVEQNNFLGGILGIDDFGNGWVISNNTFDGYTISCSSGAGGYAVILLNLSPSAQTANAVVSNNIRTNNVPSCNLSIYSEITEVFVPFAGIIVNGQNGVVIADNKISINPGSTGNYGAGIIATGEDSDLGDTNLVIFDNDTRQNTWGLIVTSDSVTGATIYNNKGVNLINGVTTIVK